MSLAYYFRKVFVDWNFKVAKSLYARGIIMPPRFVAWDCTRRCNLNCLHCGAKKENYPKELTTTEIKKFVDEIVDYGVRYFGVTGGEPLLRHDLLEVFSYAKQKGLSTTLATNGYLINEKNIPEIVKVFDSVQLSLDGPEKIHNQIRGNEQACSKVIAAIKMLLQQGVRQLTISTVITPINFPFFDELAKIVAELEPNLWKMILVMSIGNAQENDSLILNKDNFFQLVEKIKQYRKKWKKKIKIDVGENSAYLGKLESQTRLTPFFCPVGFQACCVGVDGGIRGCPEEPDNEYFTEGNILQQSFKEIWEKGFKKYRNNEFLKDKNCTSCRYQKDCRGGCWVCRCRGQKCPVLEYHL